MRLLAIITAGGLLASAAAFAQSLTFTPRDAGEPVEITSENGFELHQDTKRVIARGNAKAVQGAVSVSADELVADYRPRPGGGGDEVYRVFATGNVVMKSENETANGDAAVYDIDKAVLVMEGRNVSLTSPDGQVQAHKVLQYWSNEGVAVAEGNAFAEDKNKHRLFADRLVAFFRESTPAAKAAPAKARSQILGRSRGDINYVQGFGNVRMETATEIIRGERGAYNIDSGMATLDGGVKITQGTNQLSGGFATVNVKGGTSKLFGSAAQAGQPGVKDASRVRALIAPKADPAATPAAAPAAKAAP